MGLIIEGLGTDGELWRISHAIGLEEAIPIHSVGAEISLKDIYAFIEFSGGVQRKMDL